MKSLMILIALVAFLTGGLTTSSSSSSSSSLLFANAQAPDEEATKTITECTPEDASNCATTANRTCYNYEEDGTHKCGYCLNGFFEYEETCYNIDEIGTDVFLILSELLELYLPEYVDPTVTTEERAERLKEVAEVLSFWNSQVPPPQFTLGLNNETFLTAEERIGRMGITSGVTFDENAETTRGRMERFDAGGRRGRRLSLYGTDDDDTMMRGQRKLKEAIDWEAEGYTTIVKNQGLCGCCWATATAAAVESALMITNQTDRYDKLGQNSLSFQQMISCDEKELGCNGGNILQATRYVWEHDDFKNGNFGGLYSYEDWPYTDFLGQTTGECQAQSMANSGKKPAAYLNFPQIVNSVNDRSNFDERKDRLMKAVAIQPVASVLKSNCPVLMNYKGGVLTHDDGCECSSTSCIDHAIVIVGYDTTAPTPYWKLRNSWGNGWGENGNFRIAMNEKGLGEWGLFGMLAEAAMPSDAYQNLEDLPERPGWWETAATWEKTLVILFSIIGFCCLCGCVSALFKKYRK
mmetsp:Transcript_40788/g.85680  ORF Transcript_40788/g.85680 Transcript_40788/m.85680 type:complete len:522 (+) Transcript_40788:211-1776(+)